MPAIHLTADQVYAKRIEDGTYKSIFDQMHAMGSVSLADATYGVDFMKKVRKEDDKSLHVEYVDDDVCGDTFTTVLVGEVCPTSMGTRLSAVGSQYTGPGAKPIDDKTNVKDHLRLRNLTYGHAELLTLFNNQVATLGEWREVDEEEEKADGIEVSVVKEAIFVDPNMPNGPANIIGVTLEPKYKDPNTKKPDNGEDTPTKAPRITKQHILIPEKSGDSDNESALTEPEDTDADGDAEESAADKGQEDPNKGFELEIGAFYPPSMLPDYQGPFFQLEKNKLVQLDIRDIDNELIAPWNLYDKLRPGTVVLVVATLVTWVMPEIVHDVTSPLKKYYHVCGHKIRVLAESGEAIEERRVPTLAVKHSRASDSPSKNSAALKAFQSFESPSKKARFN